MIENEMKEDEEKRRNKGRWEIKEGRKEGK